MLSNTATLFKVKSYLLYICTVLSIVRILMLSSEILTRLVARFTIDENKLLAIFSAFAKVQWKPHGYSKFTLQGQLQHEDYRGMLEGSAYSIKFLKRAHTSQEGSLDSELSFFSEVLVHALSTSLGFSYIPKLYSLEEVPFQLKTKDISRKLMAVREYCYYGSLQGILDCIRLKGVIPNDTNEVINAHDLALRLLRIVCQLCQALAFLHDTVGLLHGYSDIIVNPRFISLINT